MSLRFVVTSRCAEMERGASAGRNPFADVCCVPFAGTKDDEHVWTLRMRRPSDAVGFGSVRNGTAIVDPLEPEAFASLWKRGQSFDADPPNAVLSFSGNALGAIVVCAWTSKKKNNKKSDLYFLLKPADGHAANEIPTGDLGFANLCVDIIDPLI